MKLNNLSAKKICRLISAGMVFSMLVITGIFGGIMQDTRIFIAGGTLTPVSYTHLDVYKRQVYAGPCGGGGSVHYHCR